MDVIINALNKIDEIMFKKVSYKVYVVGALFVLVALGQVLYDYNNNPTNVTHSETLNNWYDQPVSNYEVVEPKGVVEPQARCYEGQKQTVATPDHQRPCHYPVLFGGNI